MRLGKAPVSHPMIEADSPRSRHRSTTGFRAVLCRLVAVASQTRLPSITKPKVTGANPIEPASTFAQAACHRGVGAVDAKGSAWFSGRGYRSVQ